MIGKKASFETLNWRRINMRNVAHLLGVEFMHNLYNRHLTRINSIRFRRTVVAWKDGQVNSYAPTEDWGLLSRWVSERFIRLDETLLSQVRGLIKIDRAFFKDLIKSLSEKRLDKLDNIELGLTLIEVQEYVLGELYPVNLVQIEHSLTIAILEALKRYEPDDSLRNKLLSSIIATKVPTESQKEEIRFLRIVNQGKKNRIANPQKDEGILAQLKQHSKEYSYMHSAYGELPHDLKFYIEKYKDYYGKDISISNLNRERLLAYSVGRRALEKLNDERVAILAKLMSDIGTFRDGNKARLGRTVEYRLAILDEIARRGLETRPSLDYYLLSEVLDLLYAGKKVARPEVAKRKKNGIILVRNEYLDDFQEFEKAAEIETLLTGVCASPGCVEGICKIVYSKQDAHKIKPGEIMVAIGTDFDLLDAIQAASAIITEEGGLLSHASVVCREMQKPCCIGVQQATKKLADGMRIKLDATNGKIAVL
jgi:phosphohistidine swiveling domain-containing protein